MLAELQLRVRVEVMRSMRLSLTRRKMNLGFQAYQLADGKPLRKPDLQAVKCREALAIVEEALLLLCEVVGGLIAVTSQKSEAFLVTPQPGL